MSKSIKNECENQMLKKVFFLYNNILKIHECRPFKIPVCKIQKVKFFRSSFNLWKTKKKLHHTEASKYTMKSDRKNKSMLTHHVTLLFSLDPRTMAPLLNECAVCCIDNASSLNNYLITVV